MSTNASAFQSLSQEERLSPLGLAIWERRSDCAAALIDAGARLEMRSSAARGGRSAAATGGSRFPSWTPAARRVANSDDDDDDDDDNAFDETTALHEAVAAGLPLIVEALVEAGHPIDPTGQARPSGAANPASA